MQSMEWTETTDSVGELTTGPERVHASQLFECVTQAGVRGAECPPICRVHSGLVPFYPSIYLSIRVQLHTQITIIQYPRRRGHPRWHEHSLGVKANSAGRFSCAAPGCGRCHCGLVLPPSRRLDDHVVQVC